MRRFYSRKLILTLVTLFALGVRGVCFFFFLKSPFRHFHQVPGLDMETLLRFSEWGTGQEFPPLFVVHRLLIFSVWFLNGQVHCVPVLILLQCLSGAAGALLTADLCLMLWGKRKTALAAGIFYGLYGPLLLYDLCVLQESITTTLILLALWSYVRCRIRHFPSKLTFLSGILLGLSSIGRPVAALLAVTLPVKTFFSGCFVSGKGKWFHAPAHGRFSGKAALLLAAGVLTLWLTAALFNGCFAGNFSPFFNAVTYTVAFHTEKAAASSEAGPPQSGGIRRMICGLPRRAAEFFLIHEKPENINYYFLRNRIFPLKYLPGPALLLPVALAGIFLMLLRIKYKEGLLLLVMVLLALPLAARDPIGRYRLHLIPCFVLSAACFFTVLQKNTKRTNWLCAGALALALAVNFNFSAPAFTRVSDHVAWGRAIEIRNNGRPAGESLKEFHTAWMKSGCSDRAAAVNLISSALRSGHLKLAAQTCQEGIRGPAQEKSIYHYYTAVIWTAVRNFPEAEKALAQVRESEIPLLKKKIQILRQVLERKSL